MARIYPFRGFYFNPDKVSLGGEVLEPLIPGDSKETSKFFEHDPLNIVCSLLGDSPDHYTGEVFGHAGEVLERWIEEGYLVRDGEPAVYVYQQRFVLESEEQNRTGFIALMELDDGLDPNPPIDEKEQAIREHHLELMLATNAHLGQVLLLYSDPSFRINRALDAQVAGREPDRRIVVDQVCTHEVWKVSDGGMLKRLQRAMEGKELVIAAGSSIYQATLDYLKSMKEQGVRETGDESIRNVMVTFVNADAPGMIVEADDGKKHSFYGCGIEDLRSSDILRNGRIFPPLFTGLLINKVNV